MQHDGKRVGMKDIAEAVGVSIGTVDRALNNKPGIKDLTRERVLEAARSMGYVPNLAARHLSSKKEFLIGVSLPAEIASFFDEVRAGIASSARPFEGSGVRLVYHTYPRIGEGETEAVRAALAGGTHGVIVCPGEPQPLRPLLQEAADNKIPVVCVCTDAPKTPRTTAISVDPFVNGCVVGELMGRFLNGQGEVVLVTGFGSTLDHSEKVRGFGASIRSMYPEISVRQVLEAHEEPNEAYSKCRQALQERPGIRGLYVTTVNSMPVLRAVEDLGLSGKITIITTDLFPELAARLRTGDVAATILQRPFNQGRMAFESIYRLLTENIAPPPRIRLAPHIVMRSNLELFLDGQGY